MSDNKNPAQATKQETLTVQQIVEQLIPAAIAAAVQSGRAASQPAQPQHRALQAAPRCQLCGQEKTACGGKHVEMAVFPQRYPQHADYFTGVQINGVRYLSNDGSHKILVPEISANEIAAIVSTFEENEQAMAVGRKATRHSGTVSPNGNSVQPATQGWR